MNASLDGDRIAALQQGMDSSASSDEPSRTWDGKLAKGDRVEVKGSRVSLDGKPVLIAQEIRRGDARVVLRDGAGIPAWSRARRR